VKRYIFRVFLVQGSAEALIRWGRKI